MSTSNTVTKTDLQNIINAIFPATTEDMSQAQIDAFVASLSCVGLVGNAYVIIGVQSVVAMTSGMIADKAEATATGTITSVVGADGYWALPTSNPYGIPTSNATINGTTLSCSAMNVSGASHALSQRFLVLAYKNMTL